MGIECVLKFLRAPVPYPEYDQTPEGYNFDNERDVGSSIAYGLHNDHNVYDSATGRIVRSKSRHKVNLIFF